MFDRLGFKEMKKIYIILSLEEWTQFTKAVDLFSDSSWRNLTIRKTRIEDLSKKQSLILVDFCCQQLYLILS
jgi:hypothetical protein